MSSYYETLPPKIYAGNINNFKSKIDNLKVSVLVRYRGYEGLSGDFETYRINFAINSANLRILAITLLKCSLSEDNCAYFSIGSSGSTKGIKICAATSLKGKFAKPKSFTYVPKRELKRYPWYPWSESCDAPNELPAFGVTGIPGECDRLLWDNRRDMREPHIVYIGGSPKALIRLARLLLDYANTDIPPEEIDLEIEGGFRGVGPCSYEARFKRVNDS